MKTIKLPKKIHCALNSQIGFDKLYIENFMKMKNHDKAYDATISQIRKHVKKYKPKYRRDSYKVIFWKKDEKEIEVPIMALEAITNLRELFYKFLSKHRDSKRAYAGMMEYVHKWFPGFMPYKNYESFRKSFESKFKKKPKMKDLYNKYKDLKMENG